MYFIFTNIIANNIGNAGAKTLAKSLLACSTLGTLWLGGNKDLILYLISFYHFASRSHHAHMILISSTGNNIEDDGVAELIAIFSSCSWLQELHLEGKFYQASLRASSKLISWAWL